MSLSVCLMHSLFVNDLLQRRETWPYYDTVAADLRRGCGGVEQSRVACVLHSDDPDAVQLKSEEASWLFVSGVRGLEHFEIPLLGPEDKPATYDVRMFFTEISPMDLDGVKVSFQGEEHSGETQTPGSSSSSQRQAVVEKLYSTVRVEKNLAVDVECSGDKPQPTIAAIEVILHEHHDE